MHWHDNRDVAGADHDDVVALFARRPARWFHTFLVLAVLQAGPPTARGRGRLARHWYRLGLPDADGIVRLVWHPVPQPGLCSGFTGTVRIDAIAGGTRIGLEGEVEGGEPEVTDLALTALLDLLAAAIEESQSSTRYVG